jgi:hypothetical protein
MFKTKELSENQVPILLTKIAVHNWGIKTCVIEK